MNFEDRFNDLAKAAEAAGQPELKQKILELQQDFTNEENRQTAERERVLQRARE